MTVPADLWYNRVVLYILHVRVLLLIFIHISSSIAQLQFHELWLLPFLLGA